MKVIIVIKLNKYFIFIKYKMIYNQDGFIKNIVADNFHKDSKQQTNL